jgi:TonB family protein
MTSQGPRSTIFGLRIPSSGLRVLFTTLGLLTASPAFAQDSLDTAKDLYASAAYEDALRVFSRLQGDAPRPEIEQYRVSCLIALGRTAEADKVIQGVVASHPMFVPNSGETSPRIQELFARARRQQLPDIARQTYVEAKAALDRKDRAAALSGFERVLVLIESAGEFASGTLGELRILAAGFLDLSRALPAPSATPPAAQTASRPSKPRAITPPVALKQAMPAWLPSDNLSRQGAFNGTVRVMISAAGRVENAEIVQSVHPGYDRLLLQAARGWEYQPALSDGRPIVSEQLVQVQLKPRQ